MRFYETQPITTILARAASPDDTWLRCQDCQRFFQYKHARRDLPLFEWGCPFCGVAHIEVEIWDAAREPEDPRWPSSPAELTFGQRSPNMAPFYDALQARERASILARFMAAPEWRALERGDRPKWTESLLHSYTHWDAEPDQIFVDILGMGSAIEPFTLNLAPRPEDAAEIAAELSAYFAFAARELGHIHAPGCRAYFDDPDTVEALRRSAARGR